jgi:integrase
MPKARLTKRIVDAFSCPPDAVRAMLFDAEVIGFSVEAMRTGRKFFRFQWKRKGKQGLETIGEYGPITVEQARARATALRGKLYDGQNPAEARLAEAAARRRAITIGDLVEKWLVEGRASAPSKRESSWSTDARKLRRHIVPLLGPRVAREITKGDVETAQRQISEGATAQDVRTKAKGRSIVRGGQGAARSAVMSLSACFAWAIDQGMAEENPCLRVKKSKPRKLERFLTQAEANNLCRVLDDMVAAGELDLGFADMIKVLLLSGARKSEIQELQWSEIDFERHLVRLSRERSKTGEKTIPLNREAMTILKARQHALARSKSKDDPAARQAYVFPSRVGASHMVGLQKAWERVRARANLDGVRIHDLRHSFASFAAANGASLFLIGKALGHSQSQTTERYAHLRDDPLHALTAEVGRIVVQSPKERTKATQRNTPRA